MLFTIFKLKHDIANDSELPLAKMEIEALTGSQVREVPNLADLLFQIPQLLHALQDSKHNQRIQDVLMRMPYPGRYQALLVCDFQSDLFYLKTRLTYCRDVFAFCSTQELSHVLIHFGIKFQPSPQFIPEKFGKALTPYLRVFSLPDKETPWLLRLITDHTYLECSDHVVRLAQKVSDADRIYTGAVKHLSSSFNRAFAASVSMGYKWIEDFIDDRRAPNAYASHNLFGLRGRFFPRMVRAIANGLVKSHNTSVIDPFGGVGTLGIELSLLGIPSRSYDINPFFSLVSRAKLRALSLTEAEEALLEQVRDYAQHLRLGELFSVNTSDIPQCVIVPGQLARNINKDNLRLMARLKAEIDRICSRDLAEVAYLGLAYYSKSMATKYTPAKILTAFWSHISKILYLSRFMRRLYTDGLCTRPTSATFDTCDVRRLSDRERSVDCVITSPPYSTAIDYVGNDAIAYYTLGFQAHDGVERQMVGSSKLGWYKRDCGELTALLSAIPSSTRACLKGLANANESKALCLAKYITDMDTSIGEIRKVLSANSRAVFVVGTSQGFRITGRTYTFPLAQCTIQLAERHGLTVERQLEIDLTKNNDGDIKQETILVMSN